MEIRLAKTAGFCFGVNRAVELTYGLLAEGHKVATLGPLIHNPQAVEDMRRKGAQVVDTVQDVPAGCEVVIRSHGVPRSVYDELAARGIPYHDATCPFVQKIQRIAAEAEKEGAVLLVAGDKTHPEVQGIVGHTRGEVFVFADLAELEAWNGPSDPQKPLFAVAQTTFQVTKWKESSEFLKKPIQTPEFLIQYVMRRGRGNRKRKTSANNATSLLSLAVIILPIPKSWYRSPQNTRVP